MIRNITYRHVSACVALLLTVAAVRHVRAQQRTIDDFFGDLPAAKKTALEDAAPTSLWPANTAGFHRPESCSPPTN